MRGIALIPATTVLLLSGCGRANYADDPDLAAVRSEFRCTSPSTPAEKRACTALDRFEKAGPVKGYPAGGTTVYLGRDDCSNFPGSSIVFALRGLRAGKSSAKTDSAHAPKGMVVHSMSSTAPSPLRHRIADKTLDALRSRKPTLELTDEERADGLFPSTWRGWADRLPSIPTPLPTARSDGTSLLEGPGRIPAFWDDAKKLSAFGYLRQIDEELIYVRPESGPGLGACVEHLWKLPSP
jgi:hypothetical protein